MSFSGETNLEWHKAPYADGVMIGDAPKDGPTVGILGGVHGDEFSGIAVADLLPRSLAVEAGRVIVMLGNLPAIDAEKRQSAPSTDAVNHNLNRWFRHLSDDQKIRADLPYEANRAQELIGYIDECDAILDLHEFEDPKGTPFIITERPSRETARAIGAPFIAHGFADAEPGGTDDYGYRNGIEAICYELGPMGKQFTAGNVVYALETVDRFLAAQSLTSKRLRPLHSNPTLIQVDENSPIVRTQDAFRFAREFKSFETLVRGELVAVDGEREIYAAEDEDQVMLFYKPEVPAIGREACELARVVTE
ncbi:MAG TPA: succinylglutamate desuccinylase/aspartoacylase family protein [Candidatus Saccharimonadales bacterium]|nr:succinylglutamate desuccinylase/aspartoacylase family protein [Candidatus Saccharimonadales bacterium]